MSRFNIQEHNYTTEFPLYSSPHPITFSPGAAVAVATRLLWVGLSCQSLCGCFSHVAFLPLELSTNNRYTKPPHAPRVVGDGRKGIQPKLLLCTRKVLPEFLGTLVSISEPGTWESTTLNLSLFNIKYSSQIQYDDVTTSPSRWTDAIVKISVSQYHVVHQCKLGWRKYSHMYTQVMWTK